MTPQRFFGFVVKCRDQNAMRGQSLGTIFAFSSVRLFVFWRFSDTLQN